MPAFLHGGYYVEIKIRIPYLVHWLFNHENKVHFVFVIVCFMDFICHYFRQFKESREDKRVLISGAALVPIAL